MVREKEEEEEVKEESKESESTTTNPMQCWRGFVVGNYCHDVLIQDGHVIGESLGGAASFISNIFDGLSLPCSYISKVGPDFTYSVSHPPLLSSSSPFTTLFHAHLSPSLCPDHDRVLRRLRSSDPIYPSDLPSLPSPFDFGLSVGVAGEIIPDTLARMLDLCSLVFVDIQALIRTFDPIDGTVRHIPLKDTGFYHLLPRIRFLKASSEEAPFVNIEEARRYCCVVVTDGKDGCRIFWKDGELQIPSFPTDQIDPTGAGDSFLGGYVAGLVWGLAVPDAALLGNFFGSLTVAQIGIPKFNPRMFKKVKDELERMRHCVGSCERREIAADFRKSIEHEAFRASLIEADKLQRGEHGLDGQWDLSDSLQVMGQGDQQDSKSQQKLLFGSVYEVIRPAEDHDTSSTIALRSSRQ
ncbi:inositol 3-kinase [Magnolia sinica]|uniref:inositol 3-kinase n=1 Tax=Magnolia sinica TaxID=86752 RepID=UPI00265A726D|nr:inositol 3-kinase [Magnolia sinica]